MQHAVTCVDHREQLFKDHIKQNDMTLDERFLVYKQLFMHYL